MRSDLFGQRPLYYSRTDGSVRTATSVWALARETGIALRLDPDALAAALGGALPAGRSLFRDVDVVPPGHCLVEGPTGLSTAPYWEPPLQPLEDEALPADVARDQLLRRLRAAVRRLRPEPRAVCALSGGLDSGALLALLAESRGPVRAWSQADDFAEDDELDRARVLAEHFGAEHRVATVTEEELPEHAPEAVRACEALLWNGRAVARHRFFRAIRAGGDAAVLSGVGADEVLLGHPSALRGFQARAEAERALARSLLEPAAAAGLGSAAPSPPPSGLDGLVWRQHIFIREVLPESTLPPECRASAAQGVEARLPYLDREVADLCLRLPVRLRVLGEQGKLLLREAMRGRLPPPILAAAKRSRLAPEGGRGPRARERWMDFFAHWLSRPRLGGLGIVQPGRVAALLDRHLRGEASDPDHAIRDAVLMRLASAAILAAGLADTRGGD